MNHPHAQFGTAGMSLLAGLILAAWPTSAAAQAPLRVSFRNDTTASIHIQAACNIRGKLVALEPVLINADKVGQIDLKVRQLNLPPSVFHFVVYDANKPSKRLFQG